MVTRNSTGIDLFSGSIPAFEEIKKLWPVFNSSERVRLQMLDKTCKHGDPLGCGLVLMLCGNPKAAIEKLKEASDCLQKYMALGYCCRTMRRFGEAIDHFKKAAKLNADPKSIAMEKAETYRLAGEYAQAQEELDLCSNFRNVSADYHYHVGRLMDSLGEYEKAMDHYRLAADLDAGHLEAKFSLAYACDLRGDEETAIGHYKQVLKSNPNHVSALLNLAILYEDKADYENAVSCVETVLSSHPNHPRAQLFLKDLESSKNMIYDEEREKRKDRQNKILEIPISDFELSVRSRNCLKKMNILSIGDLLRTTEAELLSYKNFGETSLQEIKRILDSKNMRLGMALEDKNASSVDPETVEGVNRELLNKSVDELELSVRARRALSRLGVKTLFELVSKTEAELLGCKNFGVTSLNEIKERLCVFGLSLRTLE